MAHRDDAVHIVTNPFFANRARILAALAAEAALPATAEDQTFAAAGGLLSYGASTTWAYQGAGVYVGRILKGEKPGEIPIQLPATYNLAINLKTAKALGLTVPLTLLGRADEMIE